MGSVDVKLYWIEEWREQQQQQQKKNWNDQIAKIKTEIAKVSLNYNVIISIYLDLVALARHLRAFIHR